MAGLGEKEETSTISECTQFLDRLNIPINQGFLDQLREQMKTSGKQFDLNAIDVGVKDSRTHAKLNERRIQNALWRTWWRQRKTRLNPGLSAQLPLEDDFQLAAQDMNYVWGHEIGDIPTEYIISKLQPHELPVIGTYVDPCVIPGFSYRVRVCGDRTDECLFDGKALRLERVGVGYGKRLTFEDKDILANENFFWSDSNPGEGFAFSIVVLCEGQQFDVFDVHEKNVGRVVISNVNTCQKIITTQADDFGISIDVQVSFQCRFAFSAKNILPGSSCGRSRKESVSGVVKMMKLFQSKAATIAGINQVSLPGLGICVLKELHSKLF